MKRITINFRGGERKGCRTEANASESFALCLCQDEAGHVIVSRAERGLRVLGVATSEDDGRTWHLHGYISLLVTNHLYAAAFDLATEQS